MRYLNGASHHDLWIPKESECILVGFYDSDFVGCKSDKKSTSRNCHMVRNHLVSWHSKKKHSDTLSTTEVEYVVTGNFCAQVLWLKHQLLDYDLKVGCVLIKCDNTSAIRVTKNLVLHSHTKHIRSRNISLGVMLKKGMLFLDMWIRKSNLLISLQNCYPPILFTKYVGNWES